MKKAAAIQTRWGILGTNAAAQQFALGLAYLGDARLIAIGARSQAAADAFGEGNWVPRRYGAFETLADDSDIDVMYVATAPKYHRSVVRMCLDAGKAVVCDLPFAASAAEVAELIALARKRERFLMAGPWLRFLPLSARLYSLLAECVIDEPRTIIAEVGVLPPFNPMRQARDEQSGSEVLASGGALLATLASMLLGAPTRVISQARQGAPGWWTGDDDSRVSRRPTGHFGSCNACVWPTGCDDHRPCRLDSHSRTLVGLHWIYTDGWC
jgi:predicted dehydrogenase